MNLLSKNFLAIFLIIFLYSCVDMYGTVQERSLKNSRMSDYGLCEKLGVAVLAPELIREEWAREIQRRNVNCGQYANAINNKRQASQQMMNQGLSLMQQSQPYTLNGNNSDSSWGSGTTCFKKGEYTQGLNKVCQYSCTGSAHAITVGAAQLCPITVVK